MNLNAPLLMGYLDYFDSFRIFWDEMRRAAEFLYWESRYSEVCSCLEPVMVSFLRLCIIFGLLF